MVSGTSVNHSQVTKVFQNENFRHTLFFFRYLIVTLYLIPNLQKVIKNLLLIGAGSFAGGVLRYLVSILMKNQSGFPWSTFIVNIAGCLAIGLLWGLTSRLPTLSPSFTLFLMTGFCGGFTTFSTFSKEGLTLLQTNNYILFTLYTIGSVVLGIAAVALGYIATK